MLYIPYILYTYEMILVIYMCSFLPHVQERKSVNAQDFTVSWFKSKKDKVRFSFSHTHIHIHTLRSDPVFQMTLNLRRFTGSNAEFH